MHHYRPRFRHLLLAPAGFIVIGMLVSTAHRAGASPTMTKGVTISNGSEPFTDTWPRIVQRDKGLRSQRPSAPGRGVIVAAPLGGQDKSPQAGPPDNSPLAPASGAVEEGSAAPQTIGGEFRGVTLDDQVNAFGGGSIPPDTMGAVGPAHFMEIINGSVAVFTKSGQPVYFASLDSFFTVTVGGITYPRNRGFDPRVIFDRRSGRWFATAMDRGEPILTNNHIILAVSRTSSATGLFDKYLIPVGEPNQGGKSFFTDYSTLAVDDNGVYFGMRHFPSSGDSTAKIAATPIAPLLASPPSLGAVTQWGNITDMYSSPQPAHNLSPASPSTPAWFVSSSPTNYFDVQYRLLTWTGGTPDLQASSSTLSTPPYGAVGNAPAQGSTTNINNGDDRLQMAVLRNGRLWTCRNVGLNSTGGAGPVDRTGCEWLEIDTTTRTAIQNGRVYDTATTNPRSYYYPSLMVNGLGDMAIGFSGSSAGEYVGAYTAGRLASDPNGTLGSIVQLKAGLGSYTVNDNSGRNRWGDYSYTSLDPTDDLTMWTIQEYAEAPRTNWATWVAKLLAPGPTLANPSGSGDQNTTGMTLQLTGTRFYEPGPAFPSHLSVRLEGGAVNGISNYAVTYNDSASVTVTFDISASATVGPRDIVLTNPDGQSATAVGAFTVTSGDVVQFSSVAYQVSESAGTVQIVVERPGSTVGVASVDFTTTNGTASQPADYTRSSGTFIFTPGESTKTFSVAVQPDRLLEGDETVSLSLTNASGVSLGLAAATLTILDDIQGTAPSALTATGASTSSVRLQWMDNCDNEDNVEVERRVGLGQFSLITTLRAGSTSYVDNSLSPDTLYTYRLRAVRGATFTNYSNQASLTISPIRFEQPFFFAFEATGQIVIRIQRSGDILTTSTVELKRTDIEATGGVDYQLQDATLTFSPGETTKEITIPITQDRLLEPIEGFRLVLSNPMGPGSTLGDQSTLTIAIVDDFLRTSPRPLTATVVSANSVRLNWTDNCDNETSYQVRRAGAITNPIAILPPGTTTFTDTTAPQGTQYGYAVEAVMNNLVSHSAISNSVLISTVEFVQPSYTVREDDGTISFRVVRNGDITETVTLNYTTADGTAVAPGDYGAGSGALTFAPLESFKVVFVTIKNDTLLEGNETFSIALSNINGKDTVAGPAGTATVTISDDQSGLSPGNLSASVVSSTSLRLDWTDRSGNETGFEIERKPLGGVFASVQTVGANSTAFTDNGLLPGTPYIYRVRSLNAAGNSGFSNEASATTLPPAPIAPGNLTATAQDGGVAKLSWTDNSLDESGFLIERRTGVGAYALVSTLGENSTKFNDTGLAPGTSYTYRVSASNAGGVSDASNEVSVSIPVAPNAPSGLTAAAIGADAIQLTWSHAGGNVTGFKVERQSAGFGFQPVGTVVQDTTEFTDRGVTANILYTYRVRATNIGGESAPSNTARAEISLLGKLRVTPASLKFGKVKANVERTKTFKITNVGKGTLGGVVVGLEQTGGAGGPFSFISGTEPFTLVRGQVKTVTVRYRSANPGSFQGTITIRSTDTTRDSHTVALSANTR